MPVERHVIEPAQPDDVIEVKDTRGKHRELLVVQAIGDSRLATAVKTAYVEQGMPARLVRDGETLAEGAFGQLPGVVAPLEVAVGDLLVCR